MQPLSKMQNRAQLAPDTNTYRRNRSVLVLMLAVAFSLFGCNTAPKNTSADTPEVVKAATLPDGSIRYDTSDVRIAQLWAASDLAAKQEDIDKALEHLFAALEIDPSNSLIWSRCAELQLTNNQASLAENYAVKSNALANNNETLLHRNWLIIEHARSMRGDLLGVRSAHKKVQEYQY